MNREHKKRHLLLKFLLIEIIGVLIIVGITTAYGIYARPAFANDAPSELKTLSIDSLLAYNSSGATIKIVFRDAIRSVGGYWYGTNASLEREENGTSIKVEGTPGLTYKFWGSEITVTYDRNLSCSPSFKAVLPVSEANNHQMLTFAGKMDVYYPGAVGTDNFETKNESITREFNFFVVSPEELELKTEINAFVNVSGGMSYFFPFLWALVVGPIVFGIYVKIDNRRARARKTNGDVSRIPD